MTTEKTPADMPVDVLTQVQTYLLACRPDDVDGIWFAPRIHCKDGFSLSVQVHEGAYCSPRDGVGPIWNSAEIGFPSERPSAEVMEYAEDPSDPTQTVFGYVPMQAIERLVAEHGGIDTALANCKPEGGRG